MILSCNSCEKKFIVPDNAIGANGRLVQCSSCGNKWKQFPVTEKAVTKKLEVKKTKKIAKKIKKKSKKTGPDLYSPEYLAKKHGIRLGEVKVENKAKKDTSPTKFGFYNYLIVFSISLIFILRILYFSQDFITFHRPYLEVYLDYIFESLNNIKEIITNLI